MMENVHLAPEGENEDLYSGYDYNEPLLEELEEDPEFQRIVRTRYGQRPPLPPGGIGGAALPPGTAARKMPGTAAMRGGAGMARLGTGIAPESGQTRPMTGVTAAGFSSVVRGHKFDPLNQAGAISLSSTPALEKAEETPEMMIKHMEKKVNQLIEESSSANALGDYQTALDKAKEAGRKERMLCKQREQASLTDQLNLDLTYCVLFNLANQYEANQMYTEALNTYLLIVKNKMFNNGGRLRVNMGNIYTVQKKFPQAIKMYRMALDQIGEAFKSVRLKILQNIGSVFVKMGQYADAITSFEHIMSDRPDFKTAMNLTLCYHAINDREKLKRCFCRMLQISSGIDDEDRYFPTVEDDPHQQLLIEAIKNDCLRDIERERKATAEKTILTAAKLIAPVIEASFALGFDWCIEMVRSSVYVELASELEITKALTYLRHMDIPRAIETFKECNRKDSKMAGTAATNLSFVLFLEKDLQQAEKFADSAISLDRYNPHALVNKGNVLFSRGEYERSRDYYQEALSVEATCSEALYNTALVHKKLGRYHESLECFLKLQSILRSSPAVIYHLADLSDKLEDFSQSTEWFLQLISLVPTDPHILQRLGEMYDQEGDRLQAYQYHYESFRYSPTSIEVISWLGAYHMDSQFPDKAIHYFERAALIQPNQINWQLMVASCYRKTGNYQQTLQCYKTIHQRFPENIDCLKFLVRLSSDLGLKEAQEYALLLKKAEKAKENKRQRELSSGSRKSSGSAGSRGGGGGGRGGGGGGRGARASHQIQGRVLSGGSDGVARVESGGRRTAREVGEWKSYFRLIMDLIKQPQFYPSYTDPLGDVPQRRRTAARAKPAEEDEFEGVELGDDLLPE